MPFFKAAFLSSLLFISCSALAQSASQQALQKALKPWQPVEVTKKDHELTVALPGKSMTPEAYDAVIKNGICMPIWTKSQATDALKGVDKLNVTNQYKTLGYSFEKPLSTCEEMGKLTGQPSTTLMMSRTSLFSGVGK